MLFHANVDGSLRMMFCGLAILKSAAFEVIALLDTKYTCIITIEISHAHNSSEAQQYYGRFINAINSN